MNNIANNTVTCLYSADRLTCVSGAPHSLQNLEFGGSSVPHDPQSSPVAVSPPHHSRWGPRQYRFTAGQRCPSYRRAISGTSISATVVGTSSIEIFAPTATTTPTATGAAMSAGRRRTPCAPGARRQRQTGPIDVNRRMPRTIAGSGLPTHTGGVAFVALRRAQMRESGAGAGFRGFPPSWPADRLRLGDAASARSFDRPSSRRSSRTTSLGSRPAVHGSVPQGASPIRPSPPGESINPLCAALQQDSLKARAMTSMREERLQSVKSGANVRSISRRRSVLLGPGRFGRRRRSPWRRWSSSRPCGRAIRRSGRRGPRGGGRSRC